MSDDGVSAVIGVALMVLLTVALADIIAYFVFGVASTMNHTTPTNEKTIHVTGKDIRGGYYIEDNNCEWYRINTPGSTRDDMNLFNDFKCGQNYTVIMNGDQIRAIGCNSDCESGCK